MSIDISNLIRKFRIVTETHYESWQIGDGSGQIYAQNGKVIVSKIGTDGSIVEEKEVNAPIVGAVPIEYGLPVKLGIVDSVETIVGIDSFAYIAKGLDPLTINVSDKTLNGDVITQDLLPLKCWVTYPMTKSVIVYEFRYMDGDQVKHFPAQTVDLTSYIPSTPNNHVLVCLFLKNDQTIEITSSTEKDALDPMTDVDIQECIDLATPSSIPIWAWRLYEGQTYIDETDSFQDLRQIFNIPLSGLGGGGSIQIQVGATVFTVNSEEVLEFIESSGINITPDDVGKTLTIAPDLSILADLTTTQSLSNKTLVSPKISGYIQDSMGNNVVRLETYDTPVTKTILLSPGSSSNSPSILVEGTDANIPLVLEGKGTGKVVANNLQSLNADLNGTTELENMNVSGNIVMSDGGRLNISKGITNPSGFGEGTIFYNQSVLPEGAFSFGIGNAPTMYPLAGWFFINKYSLGGVPSATISNIPQIFNHLKIEILCLGNNTLDSSVHMRLGTGGTLDTTVTNYGRVGVNNVGGTLAAPYDFSGTVATALYGSSAGSVAAPNRYTRIMINIPFYRSTRHRVIEFVTSSHNGTSQVHHVGTTFWRSNAVLDTILILNASGYNFTSDSEILLYGSL